MMMNNTLAQLRELKLVGMAAAVEEQLSNSACTALSFEERLALMVDREMHQRADRRHAALLKRARLKYPQACIEDVDSRAGRGFERAALMTAAAAAARGRCPTRFRASCGRPRSFRRRRRRRRHRRPSGRRPGRPEAPCSAATRTG